MTKPYCVTLFVIEWQEDVSIHKLTAFEQTHQREGCNLTELSSRKHTGLVCWTHRLGMVVEY